MPKVKTHHEGNSNAQAKPYPSSDQLFAKPLRKDNNPKERTKNTNEYQIDDPNSTENVLKCFMKYHKASIESTRKKSLEIAEKIQNANMAVAEKSQENTQLKKRVCEMEQQAQELDNQNKELQRDVDMLKQKCATVNAKYVSLETVYDEKLAKLNIELSTLKSDVLTNNNQKENFQRQLKTAEEQSQQMIAQLKTVMRERENQMVELQMKHTQLQEHSSQVKAAFEQEKLQLEQKCEALLQLKEKELSQVQAELQQQTIAHAQQIQEHTQRQEQSQQMIAQLETTVRETEIRMVELQMKHTQLETHSAQLEHKFEELVQLKEAQLSQLQAELKHQTDACAQQIRETAHREAELQSKLTKLGDSETRCLELQQLNNELSNEALTTMQRFESELLKKQSQIDELNTQIQSFKTNENHLQCEINALKEANDQLKDDKAQQEAKTQQDRNRHESQMAEQKKEYNEMEEHYINISKKISAEKTELAHQLEAFKELQKNKLTELQDKLHQKELDFVACKENYADLERQKNSTIAELKYKMTQIGNVFVQPVGNATVLNRSQENNQANATIELISEQETATVSQPIDEAETSGDSITKIAAAIASSTSTSVTATASVVPRIRRRKQLKRPVYQMNNSDFNTDTDNDEQTDWQPRQKKYVANNKHANSGANIKRVPQYSSQNTNDVFEQLKMSSN